MDTDRRRRDRRTTSGGGVIPGSVGLRRARGQQSLVSVADGAPRESALVDRIAAVLKRTPQCWWKNIHGSAFNAGLPDLLGSFRGRCFAIECKRAGEKPTALQVRELVGLRESGAEAVWVDSFEGFASWWEGWKSTVRPFQPRG